MLDINLILIFIIIAALAAINLKDHLSAIVAMGVAGLGLCLAFLTLKAPDVAITQLVVEILCLLILIRTTARIDSPITISGKWVLNTSVAIGFLAIFLWTGYQVLHRMPDFGAPLMGTSSFYIKNAVKEACTVNLVSAINLNFRVYDTFGLAAVLFAAVIGIIVVMRKKGHKKVEERDEDIEQ